MGHVQHGHRAAEVVDAVDDAVGATARAVPILRGRAEPFADPVGGVEQWPDDELVGGCRNRLGQMPGELPARGGCDGEDVARLVLGQVVARRRCMAASRSSCVSALPCASSASRRGVCAWCPHRQGSRWSLRGIRGLLSPGGQRRLAVHGHIDTLVLPTDLCDQFGQVRFRIGERERCHGQKYDQIQVIVQPTQAASDSDTATGDMPVAPIAGVRSFRRPPGTSPPTEQGRENWSGAWPTRRWPAVRTATSSAWGEGLSVCVRR